MFFPHRPTDPCLPEYGADEIINCDTRHTFPDGNNLTGAIGYRN
jgi:hypothetical protein